MAQARQMGHRDGDSVQQDSLTVETIDHDTGTHAYRLRLTGELDLDSASKLTQRFDECIDGGAMLIVVDASQVQFMDSSGMRAIIGAGNKMSAGGGQLLIDGISGAVQQVLEISGVLERYRKKAEPA